MPKKPPTPDGLKKRKKIFHNKLFGYASFIIVGPIILVAVIGQNGKDTATPIPTINSLTNDRQQTRQPSVEQTKFCAVGCTDKMAIVEASAISCGITRASSDYRDELWQHGGCKFLAANSRLIVVNRETLSTPTGTYEIVKVSSDNSSGGVLKYLHYIYDEPFYVMGYNIRALVRKESDH